MSAVNNVILFTTRFPNVFDPDEAGCLAAGPQGWAKTDNKYASPAPWLLE